MIDWLAQFHGLENAQPVPASTDASFRRYYRVANGDESLIVMDAPPPHEDCRPFVTIAGYFESMGLNAPRIFGADFEHGFVLMSDLGATAYLDAVTEDPGRRDDLYDDAMTALLRLQNDGIVFQQRLPDYDDDFVAFELSIFREWLCGRHLALEFTAADDEQWKACCELLIENAIRQQSVFMHRDYHSRNLMVTATNNPGILDFQDAVQGPLVYDLVSLLRDCYVKWPDDWIRERASGFFDALGSRQTAGLSRDLFFRQFDLAGMQRHLKAAGIFARLKHRDEKPGYLDDIPRTLQYVADVAARHAEFAFIEKLVTERVLPALDGAG